MPSLLQRRRLLLTSSRGLRSLVLPGVAGAYASTPDHASLDIVGDIDLRACVMADDWTPAATAVVVGKWDTSANRSYGLAVATNGRLLLQWSSVGTDSLSALSTVAAASADGDTRWIRATLDVNNGAVGRDITFYTSTEPVTTDPASVTWTQLGTTVTQATPTTVFAGTAIGEVGSLNAGAANLFAGKVYYAEVRDGIAGTIVANPDFRTAPKGAGAVTDLTGKVWTVNGAARIE